MKVKLLKKVRKKFTIHQIDKVDESNTNEMLWWLTFRKPKVFFQLDSCNRVSSYYFQTYDEAYREMMEHIHSAFVKTSIKRCGKKTKKWYIWNDTK